MSGFRGWPPEALSFFEGLEADNSKAYWQAHRATYEMAVRGPMEALIEAVEPEFGRAKLFRPNRDTRFSADKSPYKTNVAAAVGGFGTSACYVSLSSDGLMVGVGLHHPSPPQLSAVRAAIADERAGPELEAVVTDLEGAGFELTPDAVKTAPRGFTADHPRIRLLRQREFTLLQAWPPQRWLHTAAALRRVTEAWRAGGPLNQWLDQHAGVAMAEGRR